MASAVAVMITTPCYCNRAEVKQAADFAESARNNTQIDRAIETAAQDINGHLHRKFYPVDATRYFDWPPTWPRLSSYTWRLRLNHNDLIAVTAIVAGGVALTAGQYFLEPVNDGPPYDRIDLNRSTSATFAGTAPTGQRAVAVTGTWGYNAEMDQVATLAAAVSSTTVTTLTVDGSSQLDAGNILIAGTERMLVTGRSMVTTGQSQQGSGAGTAAASDVALAVTDGTKYAVGEILLLDSERMLIVDIAGNTLTVKRAWDGTVLAAHTGATIYAPRQLTVTRGALGTTAATHSQGDPAYKHRVPPLIRQLNIAEALNAVLQEPSGYSRTVGEGEASHPAPGFALADLWDEARTAHGRKARTRAV